MFLDLVAVAGTEVVDIAVGDTLVVHGLADQRAAFLFFNQDKEVCLRHSRDQAPIVKVAGCQDKGIRFVLEELPAGAGGESNIHQGLVLFYTLYDLMLHRDFCEFIENVPCRGGMYVIIENDLGDFVEQGVLIQVVQRGIEFIGVGVFAVHDNRAALTLLQKPINTFLGHQAGVCNLTHVREVVLVDLVE